MDMQHYADQTLSGRWMIALDLENTGKDRRWQTMPPEDAVPAVVPGQIEDSVGDYLGGVAWYWNRFDLDDQLDPGLDYILKLGYTGYYSEFWLNGEYLGSALGYGMLFQFTVTGKLMKTDNLLAVRLVNPAGDEEIDGILNPYCFIGRTRGIVYPVRLVSIPLLRPEEMQIVADIRTGEVKVRARFRNAGQETAAKTQMRVVNLRGETVCGIRREINAPAGEFEEIYRMRVTDPSLWSVQDPYLYTAQVSIGGSGEEADYCKSGRFGFREFRVADNGCFELNGKRLYLKSVLLINHIMGGATMANSPFGFYGKNAFEFLEVEKKQLLAYKRLGLNNVRYLSSVPYPELLDYCDEIGLTVYSEHAFSWILKERETLDEEFPRHVLSGVQSAFNHASLVAWGLINETHCERQHRCALACLAGIRGLDMTRLVFVSSGRWDMDPAIGSISNPGSREWQCLWGMDGCSMEDIRSTFHDVNMGVLSHRLGDIHIYPRIPFNDEAIAFMRTFAHAGKPAFLSETGICVMASQRGRRMYEQLKLPTHLPEVRKAYEDFDALDADWERYGYQDVFAFPQDINAASCVLNNGYKWKFFDMIRSNPRFVGYCMTGDGVASQYMDEMKPMGDMSVSVGFAPLRWCLFINPTHVYAGRPFTVEAVLADEGALSPGEYPVRLRIVADRENSDNAGCVWEAEACAVIPEPDGGFIPFSFPVYKGQVTLDVPEGAYSLCAYMERGGAPLGRNEKFYVSREDDKLAGEPEVSIINVDAGTIDYLKRKGVRFAPYVPGAARGLILAGKVPDDDSLWGAIHADIAEGARAIFLEPEALAEITDEMPRAYREYAAKRLPLADPGTFAVTDNWHYHQDVAVKSHRFLQNMQRCGLADYDYYGRVWPQKMFISRSVPDEVASMAVDFHFGGPVEIGGTIKYVTGVTLGRYRHGKGAYVINTFDITGNLGTCPAADRLLLNILREELS